MDLRPNKINMLMLILWGSFMDVYSLNAETVTLIRLLYIYLFTQEACVGIPACKIRPRWSVLLQVGRLLQGVVEDMHLQLFFLTFFSSVSELMLSSLFAQHEGESD